MRKLLTIILILQFLLSSSGIAPDIQGGFFKSSDTLRPIAGECSQIPLKFSSSGRCENCFLDKAFGPENVYRCQMCKARDSFLAHRLQTVYDKMFLNKGEHWEEREIGEFSNLANTPNDYKLKWLTIIEYLENAEDGVYKEVAQRLHSNTTVILVDMPFYFFGESVFNAEDKTGLTALRHHGVSRRVIYMPRKIYKELDTLQLAALFYLFQQEQDYLISVNSVQQFISPAHLVVDRQQFFCGKKIADIVYSFLKDAQDKQGIIIKDKIDDRIVQFKRMRNQIDETILKRGSEKKNRPLRDSLFYRGAMLSEKLALCYEIKGVSG
ncbi:MAG: hypothetical protein ABIB11_01505, partial [Candidatus Omnitrophota bacterium]